MIPYQLALLGFVFAGTLLMSIRNSALAFSLVWTIGTFFLPSNRGLNLEGLPYIDKTVVINLALIAGTVFFHQEVLNRFRPRMSDILLIAWMGSIVATSVLNLHGLYDGMSSAFDQVLGFVSLLFFARIYLQTPEALKTFVYTLVCTCIAYLPLMIWEFRMSPQLHTTVYGYFPHVFIQHFRWGQWRPIVFYVHALQLGRMFALVAFLSLFPLRKELARILPFGQFAFVFPMIGLVCSLSFGPYLMFLLLSGFYLFGRRTTWLLYVMPICAFIWLGIVFTGGETGELFVDMVRLISNQRAESLEYRLEALEDYRTNIMEKPFFGWGGWGSGRITGRATDSAILIMSLSRGFVGAILYFGWHFWMMHICLRAYHMTRGSRFGNLAFSVAILFSIALSVSTIDAALDGHTAPLAVGVAAVALAVRQRRLMAPQPLAAPGETPQSSQQRTAYASRVALHAMQRKEKDAERPP